RGGVGSERVGGGLLPGGSGPAVVVVAAGPAAALARPRTRGRGRPPTRRRHTRSRRPGPFPRGAHGGRGGALRRGPTAGPGDGGPGPRCVGSSAPAGGLRAGRLPGRGRAGPRGHRSLHHRSRLTTRRSGRLVQPGPSPLVLPRPRRRRGRPDTCPGA